MQEPSALIYIGDPMCSWCWGFAPELEKLVQTYPDLELNIVLGGLRPGEAAAPLDEKLRPYLRHHWEEVARASGQAFNFASLGRENWFYDTELPARAVVTMRQLEPKNTFDFFKTLQGAFYVDAADITDIEVYAGLLEPYGADAPGFLNLMLSDTVKEQTYADFATSRRWGITGFPSTVLQQGESLRLLSSGYQLFERLDAVLRTQLEPLHLD